MLDRLGNIVRSLGAAARRIDADYHCLNPVFFGHFTNGAGQTAGGHTPLHVGHAVGVYHGNYRGLAKKAAAFTRPIKSLALHKAGCRIAVQGKVFHFPALNVFKRPGNRLFPAAVIDQPPLKGAFCRVHKIPVQYRIKFFPRP